MSALDVATIATIHSAEIRVLITGHGLCLPENADPYGKTLLGEDGGNMPYHLDTTWMSLFLELEVDVRSNFLEHLMDIYVLCTSGFMVYNPVGSFKYAVIQRKTSVLLQFARQHHTGLHK